MSETACACTKPDGTPCAARPLPGRPFCLFHDPDHAEAQAQSRRKGGAAPRRRLRRFPRLLDYQHVAELLGELFIASLNDPAAVDCQRLQAITTLARTLLKAVGTPTDTYMEHDDRAEPAPTADHLLRVYPPLPAEIETLLAAEPSVAPPAGQPAAAATLPEAPLSAAPPAPAEPSDQSAPSDRSDPPPASPDRQQDREQDAQQDPNRPGTGPSATSECDHPVASIVDPPSLPSGAPAAEPLNPPAPAPAEPASPEPADAPPSPPEPEPRHILVDPHSPWPVASSGFRPTPGCVIVDLPCDPTGWRPH